MLNKIQADQISAIRAFNRFFMRQTGVLSEGILHSPLSLTEARIVFELAIQANLTATDLCSELGLDAGYLSRILNKLEKQGYIHKMQSQGDRRQRLLNLTSEGQSLFSQIDRQSRQEVSEMLGRLSPGERVRLVEAMQTIEGVLNHSLRYQGPFFLRHHEPGDIGWVIHQHGLLYRQDYGWDERFEASVAQACADFIHKYDPQKERCWIAEMNGERVGCIFFVSTGEDSAELRFLLVAPKARGIGLGTRLVEECLRFAKRTGYHKITLKTYPVLTAAAKIITSLGFKLGEEDRCSRFGQNMVEQTWEMIL